MATHKSVDKIYVSEASLTEPQTRNLIVEISKKKGDWICYGGESNDDLVQFAERYINHHATVPGVLGPLNTSQPIHVGRIVEDPTYGRIDVLLYGNGAVVLQTKSAEDVCLYVWVEKRVAQLHRYPMPEKNV